MGNRPILEQTLSIVVVIGSTSITIWIDRQDCFHPKVFRNLVLVDGLPCIIHRVEELAIDPECTIHLVIDCPPTSGEVVGILDVMLYRQKANEEDYILTLPGDKKGSA